MAERRVASAVEPSPATRARLRSLRIRVTALIALLATVAVAVFAGVVIRIDRQLRDEQVDAELLRRGDAATRLVSFDEATLVPEDPTTGLEGVVLAVNPSFSLDEFLLQQERYGFPDPSEEELSDRYATTFFEAERDVQEFLIAEVLVQRGFETYVDELDVDALVDDGVVGVGPIELDDETLPAIGVDLDEVVEAMVENPPDELFDEAYRRYVIDAADEAGVELDFETTIYAATDTALDDDDVHTLTERVVEDERTVWRDSVSAIDSDLDVRATVLRDGPEVRGAVIAVIDPVDFDDAHARLRTRVIVLAVALVLGSVVAAWFVAGRTIRPAGQAVAQQERFLADAAHELRTPITAIRLTAESGTPETAAENLARVAVLAGDASTLTDDLLTLARMDADRMQLRREPVRLDLLVESTLARIPLAERTVSLDAHEVVVDADAALIERAVGNLVLNAVTHGAASEAEPALVVVRADADRAIVAVSDRGPGIDPRVRAALFERFHTGAGSTGHGLGLPLARWIARAHGGDVTARAPDDGDGTEFVLALPR